MEVIYKSECLYEKYGVACDDALKYVLEKFDLTMTQEELIKFLKENLKLSISCGYSSVNVKLYLGNNLISSSSDYLESLI